MTTKMMTRRRRARARMSWRTGEGFRRSEMDGLLHCGGGFLRPRVRVRVLRLMGITRKIGKRWFFYHRFFPFLLISHFNRNISPSLPSSRYYDSHDPNELHEPPCIIPLRTEPAPSSPSSPPSPPSNLRVSFSSLFSPSGGQLINYHLRHLLCSHPPPPYLPRSPSTVSPSPSSSSSSSSCIYRCSDLYFIPIS